MRDLFFVSCGQEMGSIQQRHCGRWFARCPQRGHNAYFDNGEWIFHTRPPPPLETEAPQAPSETGTIVPLVPGDSGARPDGDAACAGVEVFGVASHLEPGRRTDADSEESRGPGVAANGNSPMDSKEPCMRVVAKMSQTDAVAQEDVQPYVRVVDAPLQTNSVVRNVASSTQERVVEVIGIEQLRIALLSDPSLQLHLDGGSSADTCCRLFFRKIFPAF